MRPLPVYPAGENNMSGHPMFEEKFMKQDELLVNIKARLPTLEILLEKVSSPNGYEDPIYRFYYQSFKVYWVQSGTKEIVEELRKLAPIGQILCKEFEEIIRAGAGNIIFKMEHNKNWMEHTRVFVEAFSHAKYFLEMAVKYGKELGKAPDLLPSGWAALLCLYNLR